MRVANDEVELTDLHPSRTEMCIDVMQGFRERQKWISSMYFYDRRGSELFDRICELPEYYPTRTEISILRENAVDIATTVGPGVLVIEPGSGSGEKARMLLRALDGPVAFVPVEISREHLKASAESLNADFPDLEVLPVCADFSREFEVPAPGRAARRRLVFFPGSTIGNFEPDDACELLRTFRTVAGPDGALLVGVDLRKDPAILERAYNDSAGVTAEFNLNLLVRLNRDLGADFDVSLFEHRAIWNDAASRIEMHLVSSSAQSAHLCGEVVEFEAGETIHTESSNKYSIERFAGLAQDAGLRVERVWTDPEALFSIQLLSGGT